jgi:cell division inhibitor SulA/protein ImuA
MSTPPLTAAPALSLAESALAKLAKACRFGRVNDLSLPAIRATGLEELDRALPIGGWPIGALTEIMPRTAGIGELRLVIPALAKLTHEQRYIAFVEPPYLPYPPALVQLGVRLDRVLFVSNNSLTNSSHANKWPASSASSLWAAEQMLRCATFGAVLVWPTAISDKELRRLQLAAEVGKNLAVVYRSPAAAQSHSPAALRLHLQADADSLRIEIKKCRGGRAGGVVHCRIGADDIPIHRVA